MPIGDVGVIGSVVGRTFDDAISEAEGWAAVAADWASAAAAATADSTNREARVNAAIGRPGPKIGTYTQVTLGADGRIMSGVSPTAPDETYVAGALQRLSPVIDRIAANSRPGPKIGDAGLAIIGSDGRLMMSIRSGAPPLAIDDAGGLSPLGGSVSPGGITWLHSTTAALAQPDTSRDWMILTYGQSYSIGVNDLYADSGVVPYNTAAISGAYMPAPGPLPGATSFGSYAGLREIKTGDTVETIASEMAKGILGQWAAAGLTSPPRLIVGGYGHGGQPIRVLMHGGADFAALMAIVDRCVATSKADGKRLVIPAVAYQQGEANRSGADYATRAEWAAYLVRLQQCLEYEIRARTGQAEPVVLVTTAISRNNRVQEVALGAIEAALANPDRIVMAGPAYAVEHYPIEVAAGGSWHPSVSGYRRLGRYFARAITGRVFGMRHRLPRITRWWMHSTTELRFEAEGPSTALSVDTSGALVDMTYMDVGRGFVAADKNGAVAISAVAAGVSGHALAGLGAATGSITFATAPDVSSLRVTYACSSSTIGGGLGGSYTGPRGCLRFDDGVAVDGLTLPDHSFVLPVEMF